VNILAVIVIRVCTFIKYCFKCFYCYTLCMTFCTLMQGSVLYAHCHEHSALVLTGACIEICMNVNIKVSIFVIKCSHSWCLIWSCFAILRLWFLILNLNSGSILFFSMLWYCCLVHGKAIWSVEVLPQQLRTGLAWRIRETECMCALILLVGL